MEDMLFVNFKDERISDIPKDVLYLILQGITLTPHWELLPFKADVARLLKDYFYSGGLAESFLLLDKRTWHQSLYDKILLSDIVVRNHIRNERSLRLMARKLAESVMQPTSVKHILSEPDTKLLENLVASQLVQVSYSIYDAATRKREIYALKKTSAFLNASDLTIVTYEKEETIIEDGLTIEVTPLYKFMLR